MNAIKELENFDFILWIFCLFTLLFAIKESIEIFLYFKNKLRIKFGYEDDKNILEKRISVLEEHDKWQYNEISKISKGIEDIQASLNERKIKDREKTVATLRTQLYDLHGKFMDRKSIDKSGLKTFLELGKIYEEAGGDDIYHDKLKPEIMSLPISDGKINE